MQPIKAARRVSNCRVMMKMFHGSTSPRNSQRRRPSRRGHAEAKATTAAMCARTHSPLGDTCLLMSSPQPSWHTGFKQGSRLWTVPSTTPASVCLPSTRALHRPEIYGRHTGIWKKNHLISDICIWSLGLFCSTHVQWNTTGCCTFLITAFTQGAVENGISEEASFTSSILTLLSPLLAFPHSGSPPCASPPLHGLPTLPLSRADREMTCEIKSNSSLQLALL